MIIKKKFLEKLHKMIIRSNLLKVYLSIILGNISSIFFLIFKNKFLIKNCKCCKD